MSTDPTEVSAAQLVAALKNLGIDTTDVRDIRLVSNAQNGGYIELRRLRRDPEGRTFLAGGQLATVTTTVGILPARSTVRAREAIDNAE